MLLKLVSYKYFIDRLVKKGYTPRFIKLLMKKGITSREHLQDEKKIKNLTARLVEEKMQIKEFSFDEESNVNKLIIADEQGKRVFPLDMRLIKSIEYETLVRLNEALKQLENPPFMLLNKNDLQEVGTKEELLLKTLEIGKAGTNIQRYKGLGEMNPDQLWETTMNPESRKLLQVRVEDDVVADEIFTVLMGDQIAPRRNFIEDNALLVSNLDV